VLFSSPVGDLSLTGLLKLFKGLFLLNCFLSVSSCKANSDIEILSLLALIDGDLVNNYLPK